MLKILYNASCQWLPRFAGIVLLSLLPITSAFAADPGVGVFKTMIQYNGTCLRAVLLDTSIMPYCSGPAVEAVDSDGISIMIFKLTSDRAIMFVAAKGSEQDRQKGVWKISRVHVLDDKQSPAYETTDATCRMENDIGLAIACDAVVQGKSFSFLYSVTGRPEVQDLQAGGGEKLMFQYWDDLNGTCKAYSVNGESQDPSGCRGYFHIGYTGGRVALVFSLADVAVIFSSDHDMVMKDGRGELPVSYLYHGQARMPAVGECTTDADWHSKSLLVCDASTSADQQPFHVRIEFSTTGLTTHLGGVN